MKQLFYTIGALAASAMMFEACSNSDSAEIGSSLVKDETEVIIDSSFTITGVSKLNSYVQSRTTTQLLGQLDAEGYGKFSSDFISQFLPATQIVTEGVTADQIDSMKLIMSFPRNGFVGDSIVPMGLEVYRVTKELPFPIFSNFDPEGYFSPEERLGTAVYTANTLGMSDSIKKLSYHDIEVKLPLPLAKELFNLYVEHPQVYSVPSEFAKYFGGVYVRNSFGSGRVVKISSSLIQMYYHTITESSTGTDSIIPHTGNYYAVTPEVITNNNISYTISPSLEQRIENGEAIVVAPIGRDVEIEFPVKNVIDYYNEHAGALSVVNSLSFSLPVEEIENDYGITPPPYLLLILSKDKDSFFLKNDITNDETSFYAAYDATNKCYNFSAMRPYLMKMMKEEELKPEDYTFTITPVTITTETNGSSGYYGTATTYVSSITPYVETPVMINLKLDEAKTVFTFTKQSVK